MSTKAILVTGATGKTGSRVAKRLEAAGHVVRSGSRRATIPFDWDNASTWTAALADIGSVYVNYHPDFAFPGAIENLAAFTRAAKAADVERLVMLTGRGEYYAELGEGVLARSGLDFTIVRSAWFAQNFSEGSMHGPVMAGVLPMPGGNIAEPIVDIDDLADVLFNVLTEDGHAGQVYEATGPRLLTFAEMADILSGAIGRRIDYLPISFEEFRTELTAASGEVFANIVTNIAKETFDGRNARLGDGVTRVLGRSPRDFTEFARAAAWAGKWAAAA